jgi:hypothetical protein
MHAQGRLQIVSFLVGFVAQSLQLTFSVFAGLTIVLALVRASDPPTFSRRPSHIILHVGHHTSLADVQQAPGKVGSDEGDEEDAMTNLSSFFRSLRPVDVTMDTVLPMYVSWMYMLSEELFCQV